MSETVAAGRRWGARSIASLLIFILAAALAVPAMLGHWGHRTVIDSTRYIETVGPLGASPEVQQAVADAVTQAVLDKVDTEKQVDDLLTGLFPDRPIIQNLSAPISAGINSAIASLIDRFVASDQFQQLWLKLNTALQRGLVAILAGETNGTVTLQGDQIVLDISSLLGDVQQYLVDQGISAAANISIPDTDRQIVLAEAPALAQLRLIYSLTSPVLEYLPLVLAALFALSIWLARRRARTSVATGIVLLASGVVVVQSLSVGENIFVDQLAGTVFAPASQVFWNTLFLYLVEGAKAIAILGAVVMFAGWLSGRTKSARWVRGHVTRGLAEISSRMPEGLQGSLAGVIEPVRWAIFVLGVLLIMLTDVMSVSAVLWTSALTAGLLTVAQLLSVRPGEGPKAIETVEVVEIIEVES